MYLDLGAFQLQERCLQLLFCFDKGVGNACDSSFQPVHVGQGRVLVDFHRAGGLALNAEQKFGVEAVIGCAEFEAPVAANLAAGVNRLQPGAGGDDGQTGLLLLGEGLAHDGDFCRFPAFFVRENGDGLCK